MSLYLHNFRAEIGIPWGACHFLTLDKCKGVADMASIFNGGSIWHGLTYGPKAKFIYENSATFAVVRNPYERAISMYYYEAKKMRNSVLSEHNMNDYLLNELKKNWKYLPQSLYIYDQEGNKVVDHVLQFERLDTEFEMLMKNYTLNIKLPDRPVNARSTAVKLDTTHLSKRTVHFINEYYERDFSNFGYEKLVK